MHFQTHAKHFFALSLLHNNSTSISVKYWEAHRTTHKRFVPMESDNSNTIFTSSRWFFIAPYRGTLRKTRNWKVGGSLSPHSASASHTSELVCCCPSPPLLSGTAPPTTRPHIEATSLMGLPSSPSQILLRLLQLIAKEGTTHSVSFAQTAKPHCANWWFLRTTQSIKGAYMLSHVWSLCRDIGRKRRSLSHFPAYKIVFEQVAIFGRRGSGNRVGELLHCRLIIKNEMFWISGNKLDQETKEFKEYIYIHIDSDIVSLCYSSDFRFRFRFCTNVH